MNPINLDTKKHLALHLADRALSPIFSSVNLNESADTESHNSAQASALSSITNTAVIAYDASLRFGAGVPLKIMVETSPKGPLLLSSYLNPQSIDAQRDLRENTLPRLTNNGIDVSRNYSSNERLVDLNQFKDTTLTDCVGSKVEQSIKGDIDEKINISPLPPLLIASVVSYSSTEAVEASKAITHLVRAGQECQKAWAKEQETRSCRAQTNGTRTL